jgi:replicative DNA helicase
MAATVFEPYLENEIAVLGCLLLDPERNREYAAELVPGDFFLASHRVIFRCIAEMMEADEAVDYRTVCDTLRRRKVLDSVGGPAYVAYLSEGIPKNWNPAAYVARLREVSLSRQTVVICETAIARCSDGADDVQLVLSETQVQLAEAAEGIRVKVSLADQGAAEFETLEKERRGEQAVFCPSGLSTLDDIYGGYAMGEMTVLAARPNIGKSPMLRQAVLANCEEGNFCHLFTPEMRAGQVLRCLWAVLSRVPFGRLRHPERLSDLDLAWIKAARETVDKFPLVIDDARTISAAEVVAKVKAVNRRRKAEGKGATVLVGVDYLQKLRYKGRVQDRHVEITDGMVALTSLASTERVALVLVSSITDQDGKRAVPTMDSLRGSGDIKFEANSVYLLHREINAASQKLAPETTLIAGKSRSDTTGAHTIYFDGQMQVFHSQEEFLQSLGK